MMGRPHGRGATATILVGTLLLASGCVIYDYRTAATTLPQEDTTFDDEQAAVRHATVMKELRQHLSGELGRERNVTCAPEGLRLAGEYIKEQLRRHGLEPSAEKKLTYNVACDPWKVALCSAGGVPGEPSVKVALSTASLGMPRSAARRSRGLSSKTWASRTVRWCGVSSTGCRSGTCRA
jgi:hypothetical protein